MKTQSNKKGWAFVLTIAMVFSTVFGGFSFLGIRGAVGEVYAAGPTRSTTLDLTSMVPTDKIAAEGWAWDGVSTLTLNGINLSTSSDKALIVPANTTIELVGVNQIESTQVAGGVSHGIYGADGLTIGGTGTLTVTGGATTAAFPASNNSYGIYVNSGNITINSGTVTATGGTSANGTSIGIAPYWGTVFINGGTVNATGGTANGFTGSSYGLEGSFVIVSGGTLITNTSSSTSENYGIRASQATISGISTSVQSSGKGGFFILGNLTICGGANVTGTGKDTTSGNSFGFGAENFNISGSNTVVTANGGHIINDGNSYGITQGYSGTLTIDDGTLNANGGNVGGANGNSYGIFKQGNIVFNGGTINAIAGTATTGTAIIATGTITFGSGPATAVTSPVGGGLSSNGKFIATVSGGAVAATSATIEPLSPAKAITAFNFNGLTPNITGTVNETAKTVALTVPYGTDVTALVPTITHTGASVSPNTGAAQNFTSPVTYTVTAANGTTQAYTVTVTVATGGGGSGGGGSNHSSSAPTSPGNATIKVNGQSVTAGTITDSKVGDKTVTKVTIDDKKIQEIIKEEGNNSTVSIPISGSPDVGEGVLNGQTIKDMEKKESVLEIKTNGATYTLPAAEINIDSVSSQFGQSVKLEDIKISVKIKVPTADVVKVVADTANKNNSQVVVKPVEFEITCSNGNKTVSVSKFNGYVERMVAIPDGVEPGRITTGVVLNKDGSFSHVPTVILKIDRKYYAKINSLTNSTYSVIYNPVTFGDVTKHWAKDSINNMGSRLVISGVGENEFEPNRDITRAEFAAIMVRALGLAPDATKNTFSDVAVSKWYSGYVGTAASYGIISGYDADTFAPNAKITREQAMTMVARATGITGLDTAAASSNTSSPLTSYTDTAKISSYAKTGVIACLNTGVVTGKTADTIAPKNNITRAEVAIIIDRLLKKSELI